MALYFLTNPVWSNAYSDEVKFKTLVSDMDDGVTEQRRNKGSQSKKLFYLQYKALGRIDQDRLFSFYRLCKGSKTAFYIYDPVDYIYGTLLPYDQVKAYLPLHEGSGTKLDDIKDFIYPLYSCRFLEDNYSREYLTEQAHGVGLKIVQESPIAFTNNYGTLAGTYSWVQVYDGTVCPSFITDGYITFGDAADLDVGTGDFSLAIGVYANSLAAASPILSKKADNLVGTDGYSLTVDTNGHLDLYFSDGTTLKTLTSPAGAIVASTWYVITVTMDRDGNGQIYVNNVASGAAVDISAASGNADSATAAYIARQGTSYGTIRTRNFMFAKKCWTAAERTKIWDYWRTVFGI